MTARGKGALWLVLALMVLALSGCTRNKSSQPAHAATFVVVLSPATPGAPPLQSGQS